MKHPIHYGWLVQVAYRADAPFWLGPLEIEAETPGEALPHLRQALAETLPEMPLILRIARGSIVVAIDTAPRR